MEEVFSYLKEFNFASVVLRLTLATLSGALIGYGREKKGSSNMRSEMTSRPDIKK